MDFSIVGDLDVNTVGLLRLEVERLQNWTKCKDRSVPRI